MTLPDCPHCDSAQTLHPLHGDYQGSIWCACSCCAKTVLVKDGRIVHPPKTSDTGGVPMFDP